MTECVCNIGVQECPIHPGRLRTEDEKIKFEQDWDARYEASLPVLPPNPECYPVERFVKKNRTKIMCSTHELNWGHSREALGVLEGKVRRD